MALGPTHEEVVTDLVSRHLSSYRQMPLDALPDPDEVSQRGAAAVRRAAHQRIPHEGRLQLRRVARGPEPQLREDVRRLLPHLRPLRAAATWPSRPRAAPSAATPATNSWSPAENGEDVVLHCPDCGYAANQERAEIGSRDLVPPDVAAAAAGQGRHAGRQHHRAGEQVPRLPAAADDQDAHLPGRRQADRRAAARRPRRQRGEDPPRRGAAKIELADPATIQRVTGAPVGFAGPVGMKEKIPLLADRDVQPMRQRRHRGQRGRRAPDGREPGPRFPARPLRRPPQRRRRRPLPALQQHAARCGTPSRWATSSSWARSTPRPWPPASSTRTSSCSPIIMGCYGIGINRIIAALIETCARRQRHHLAAVAGPLRSARWSRSR